MLEFDDSGLLVRATGENGLTKCTIEKRGKIFWISNECDSSELRQIAYKLDELNKS